VRDLVICGVNSVICSLKLRVDASVSLINRLGSATMYTIAKRFAFSASHVIGELSADHPCGRLHGYNYEVEVSLQSPTLDATGFVRDFHELRLPAA
jgi:6-pyruvoyl tetrahydropterin synthase